MYNIVTSKPNNNINKTKRIKIMTTMTPYAATKLVNAALEEAGLEKAIPPQMMYTYANKGYIKSVKVDGKVRVTQASLDEWLTKYINKLTGNTVEETDANIDEHQLTLEFDETEA